jgi:ribonuclease D
VVNRLATAHAVPPENLLAPDAVRRLAWAPPEPAGLEEVSSALKQYGARQWQIDLTAAELTDALPVPG